MKKTTLKNKRGFAVLEAVAFLVCFIVLTAYVVDFFSAIHTGIVGSIAARGYLFETLQHRTNIDFLRQNNQPEPPSPGNKTLNLLPDHSRFHATIQENPPDIHIWAAGRRLTQVGDDNEVKPNLDTSGGKASTILLKTGYGICIDAQCPKEGG